jgi:hypothetical protein
VPRSGSINCGKVGAVKCDSVPHCPQTVTSQLLPPSRPAEIPPQLCSGICPRARSCCRANTASLAARSSPRKPPGRHSSGAARRCGRLSLPLCATAQKAGQPKKERHTRPAPRRAAADVAKFLICELPAEYLRWCRGRWLLKTQAASADRDSENRKEQRGFRYA